MNSVWLVLVGTPRCQIGGSTPSLATIILKQLTHFWQNFSVRSQSAIFQRDPVRFLTTLMVKDLGSIARFSVRIQSASVYRMAENRSQHCPGRSHAILADTVGITLKGQLMRRVLYRSPRD